MKNIRFILLLAAVLGMASCTTLKVIMDKKSPSGVRTVVTAGKKIANYKGSRIKVALGERINGKDTVLAVLAVCDMDTNHGIFNQGDRMMIKFKDGSQIGLENLLDRKFRTETSTAQTTEHVTVYSPYGHNYYYNDWGGRIIVAPYEVNAFVPRTYIEKDTYSFALYLISKSDMLKLIESPVEKLRIETENDEVDMGNPTSACKIFGTLYKNLQDGINRQRSEF